MKVRFPGGAVVAGLAVMVFAGMAGCGRKAVHSQMQPPAAQSTTGRPAETSPSPSTAGPTAMVEPLVPVFFGLDSYALDDAARAALDRNARRLRDSPSIPITIEGHCDERGTVEYNQALGERRAQAVLDYLSAAGIARERVQVISYGKERPFDHGHDEAAWASNRRAQFVGP